MIALKRTKRAVAVALTCFLVAGSAAPFQADVAYGSRISEMFQANVSKNENTWLFAGGVETQGRFAEIGGARSYVDHFEEYIRGTKQGTEMDRQRYMINVGREGCDILHLKETIDDYFDALKPRALVYMIGKEDFSKGEEGLAAFGTALSAVMTKALALRDGNGYMVIQFPHAAKDAQENEAIADYIEKARSIAAAKSESDRSRIVLVDHYAQTNTDAFQTGKLTEEGLLNAEGHYEVAKQLARATFGTDGGFRDLTHWTKEASPENYLEDMPLVKARKDSLIVSVPENLAKEGFRYQLSIGRMELTGTAEGDTYTIESLPENAAYELTVQSADGKSRLKPVTGIVARGSQGGERELSSLQQAIADRVNGEAPLTWLFMGDSITHGLLHTHGYDSISQAFRKYLMEDLGREEDIVINTGNSATTAGRTLENIEQRLKKYRPDIVSVMLGTNDAKSDSTETYIENMVRILEEIRATNPDALIILRSPTPVNPSNNQSAQFINGLDGENGYIKALQKLAEEEDILFVDQYTEWKKEFDAYPYLFGYYFGDYLHPGAVGQMRLAREFIEACGLNTNTAIADHSYQTKFSYANEQIAAEPPFTVEDNAVSFDRSALQEAYTGSGTLGDVTVVLTDSEGKSYRQSMRPDESELVMEYLPVSRRYHVSVEGMLLGSEPKRASFADAEITLSTGKEAEDVKNRLAELKDAYDGGEGYYTKESHAFFREVYDRVQKESETETDVEALVQLLQELESAYVGLKTDEELKQADQQLHQAVSKYQAIVQTDGGKYVEASWNAFLEAFRKANEALSQGEKEAGNLKTLAADLERAYAALEAKKAEQGAQKLQAPAIQSLNMVADKKMVGVEIAVEQIAGADSYTVYRLADGKETMIGKTDASQKAYDVNPYGGKALSYYAVAESSAASVESSEKGAPKTITLAAGPKKVTARQQKGKAQVLIVWKAVKGAKSYAVYRSEKKEAGYSKIATVKKVKKAAYTDKKAKKGKTYYYRILAKTKAGYGAFQTSKAVKIKK